MQIKSENAYFMQAAEQRFSENNKTGNEAMLATPTHVSKQNVHVNI